jgi:hypothetical protein
MNRKQLTILLLVGLVVGAAGWYAQKQRASSYKTSEGAGGEKLIPNFPINEIAQVRIKQAAGELNLVKQEDLWRVKERFGYPANFSELGDFLRKLQELKVVQDVKVGASQLGRLELNSPEKGGTNGSGTLVEFKDAKGGNLKSLLLGKKHVRASQGDSQFGGGDFPVGRYVMVPDGASKVWLINDPLSNVETKPEQWLDKEFFKVEKLKSVTVTHPEATNSWALTRDKEGGDLKLTDAKEGESLDTGKASGAGYALSSPTFQDVVSPEAKAEDTGLEKPILAKLETFDGFTYTATIGKASGEENYHFKIAVDGNFEKERKAPADEKPEDKEKADKDFKEKVSKLEEKLKKEKGFEKWTYLVAKWTIDPLLKTRKDLLAEKKTDAPAEGEKKDGSPAAPDPLKSIVPQIELPK